jgi:hypothetical protein
MPASTHSAAPPPMMIRSERTNVCAGAGGAETDMLGTLSGGNRWTRLGGVRPAA